MIAEPINDVACLSKVTRLAADAALTERIRNLATRYTSTRELAAWIRTLPQRNDLGVPDDGPKIDCDVDQRVRIPADNPNCVERGGALRCGGRAHRPDSGSAARHHRHAHRPSHVPRRGR